MSKGLKIFLIVAGATIGVGVLLFVTGAYVPIVNSVISFINDAVEQSLGQQGIDPPSIPTMAP